MPEQVFDPLARNWEVFENNGLTVLQEQEAILAVLEPEAELAAEVASNYDELEPEHLKCMVLADMFPVTSLAHVLVVSRRVASYETSTNVERAMVGGVAHAVVGRMRERLNPKVGFAVSYFGKIPTFHANIAARQEPDHAVCWAPGDRTKMNLEARQELVGELGFGDPLAVPTLQAVQSKALQALLEN